MISYETYKSREENRIRNCWRREPSGYDYDKIWRNYYDYIINGQEVPE